MLADHGSAVSRRFDTTRWSLVLAARTGSTKESRAALAALCEAYWYPIYALIRRQGHGAEEARDLAQGYFARLIEKKDLRQVDPDLGRFRSFLLVSVRHFLSNERDRELARKRSPGQPILSLDVEAAESLYRIEPVDSMTPETVFERKWAMAVVDRVLGRLAAEAPEGESRRRFERLRGYLVDAGPGSSYREAAAELGMTEDAVKSAVYRLRQRFAEILREEIGHTVQAPADVDEEIRHLMETLGA